MNNLIYTNFEKHSFPPPPTKKNQNKFNFKKMKNNTICSLHEVECFLTNFHKFSDCVKLYKILK